MRSNLLRATAAVIAIASFAVAATTSRFLFVALGLLALFVLATLYSTASRLSAHLAGLRSEKVDVHVWGVPLPPGSGDQPLTLTAVHPLSAGLHLYLKVDAESRPGHLKIAQPSDVVLNADGIVIGKARYIQWKGKRLPQAEGVPAFTVRQSDV